ncbi:MAG: helix-turn-helix domain-containing protein [Thermoleophilia bacterium]
MSLRELARQVGVDVAHLSRVASASQGREISGQLAGRVADALSLPNDFFVETRQASVLQAIRADREFLDRVYDALAAGPEG